MSNVRELGFAVCDGTPCFMNITPGVTTIAEATSLLKTKGEVFNRSARHSLRFSIDKIYGNLALMPDNPHVLGIELSPEVAQISLMEFIELFGEPCAIRVAQFNR